MRTSSALFLFSSHSITEQTMARITVPDSLYRAARFANFEGILDFSEWGWG